MPLGSGPHTPSTEARAPHLRRLAWSASAAALAVIGATVIVPSYGDDAALPLPGGTPSASAPVGGDGHSDHDGHDHDETGVIDGHGHNHNDATTKNAISRADTGSARTADPTTAQQRRASARAVARQRAERDPDLVPIAATPDRAEAPQNRYAMAGGCYALRPAGSDRWVMRDGDGFALSPGTRAKASPFHFQATDLGKYLLFGSLEDFLARGSSPLDASTVRSDSAPSPSADWTVRGDGSAYTFTIGDQSLAVADNGALVMAEKPTSFALRLTEGCSEWPEIGTSMKGRTFRGVSDIQEVRGYVDGHTHGMAFEFLGGKAHCGRPWHPYGVAYALKDCDDHTYTNGYGAALETALSGRPGHDPVGWPTFKDWPAPDSLTHEGTYYKWMERSWRGGLRLFVNLLVENNQLCQLYPLKQNSCDDMDSIRLQAKDMRAFERYIDAQYGGPGKGWYRIVTNPFQARRVINDGKLAVVMGIETSIPFKCTMKADVPQCDKDSIDQQLAEVHKMGVRQMELVNKFDNALSGVAGDAGQTGVAVNSANFLETGSYWAMEHCEPKSEGAHDKEQYAAPEIDRTQQDALFGVIYQLFGPKRVAPVYDSPAHCNQRGLTDLGRHLITRMTQRGMVFDPDHMSVAARDAALDLLEKVDYPGVISSHSWATPDAYPRIYRLGGTITPYAGDSEGFVKKWRQHVKWADPRYYFGIGYGADMNGLGAQGDPRGADVPNPVTYPFTALGGVEVLKQRSGERVYDINVDGVSHYGLYPDWIEDLTKVAGADGDAIFEDMGRGTEAYLQMWERAVGVNNDGCRDRRALTPAATIRDLPRGASVKRVLMTAGQPHTRLGDTFGYCAKTATGTTRIDVVFDDDNRMVRTG